MKLVRYNPFNDIDFWGNSFNSCFNDSVVREKRSQGWTPVVDILSQNDTVVLNVELPGMKKENISVNIEEKVLTIKGERKLENEDNVFHRRERYYGNFKRSFNLSDDILTDEVSADYTDGILKVTLKKDTTKEEVKEITIN